MALFATAAALMASARTTRGPPALEQQFTANSSESTFINGKFLEQNYFDFHFDVPGQRYGRQRFQQACIPLPLAHLSHSAHRMQVAHHERVS
jgi:hypothetical protein